MVSTAPARVPADALTDDGEWMEARLIEARRTMAALPSGGSSKYAGDGPWHLYVPLFSERYDPHADGAARVVVNAILQPRPDRTMIDRADEAVAWLNDLVTDDDDRRLIVIVIMARAAGYDRLPWHRMLRAMGKEHGRVGMLRRYNRAINSLADAVKGAGLCM